MNASRITKFETVSGSEERFTRNAVVYLSFAEIVNNKINDGWQPYGAPVYLESEKRWYMAMVVYASQPQEAVEGSSSSSVYKLLDELDVYARGLSDDFGLPLHSVKARLKMEHIVQHWLSKKD